MSISNFIWNIVADRAAKEVVVPQVITLGPDDILVLPEDATEEMIDHLRRSIPAIANCAGIITANKVSVIHLE